jgi:hypothetical protein
VVAVVAAVLVDIPALAEPEDHKVALALWGLEVREEEEEEQMQIKLEKVAAV